MGCMSVHHKIINKRKCDSAVRTHYNIIFFRNLSLCEVNYQLVTGTYLVLGNTPLFRKYTVFRSPAHSDNRFFHLFFMFYVRFFNRLRRSELLHRYSPCLEGT